MGVVALDRKEQPWESWCWIGKVQEQPWESWRWIGKVQVRKCFVCKRTFAKRLSQSAIPGQNFVGGDGNIHSKFGGQVTTTTSNLSPSTKETLEFEISIVFNY